MRGRSIYLFPAFHQVGEKTDTLLAGCIGFKRHARVRHRVAAPCARGRSIACRRCQGRLRGDYSNFRGTWSLFLCRSYAQEIQIFGRLFQNRRGYLRGTQSESGLQRAVAKAIYQARDTVRIFEDQLGYLPGEQALGGQTCPRDPVMKVFFELFECQWSQTADATNPLLQLPQIRTPQDFAQLRLSSHNDLQQLLARGLQVQQETNFFQEFSGEPLGFIDDQHRWPPVDSVPAESFLQCRQLTALQQRRALDTEFHQYQVIELLPRECRISAHRGDESPLFEQSQKCIEQSRLPGSSFANQHCEPRPRTHAVNQSG